MQAQLCDEFTELPYESYSTSLVFPFHLNPKFGDFVRYLEGPSQPYSSVTHRLQALLSPAACQLWSVISFPKRGKRNKDTAGGGGDSLFLWNFPRHTPKQSYVSGRVDEWKAHGNPPSTHPPSLRKPSTDQPNAFQIERSPSRLYKGEFSFSLVSLKAIFKIKNYLPKCLNEGNN